MSRCESLLCPAPDFNWLPGEESCVENKGGTFGVGYGQSWAKLTHESHRYAMLLNGLLAAFFIVVGSFNGLVVLIGTFLKG